MKKLAVLGIICAVVFYGYPDILGYLGFGKAKFGISDKDPLGDTKKLHDFLIGSNFDGDFGEAGKPRTLGYSSKSDGDKFKDFGGGIVIAVGEEEYVQKISGVFVGTQHGMSPQRAGVVESIMTDLWRVTGGPSKPKWEKVSDGKFTFPSTIKFGKGFSIPINHQEATYTSGDVVGKWLYSERDNPMEVIELKLK